MPEFDGFDAVRAGPEVWAEPWEFRAGGRVWMDRAMKDLARSGHPVYAMIRSEPVTELPTSTDESDETVPSEHKSPLYRSIAVSHEWTASLDDALMFDVGSFLAQLLELADAFASQLTAGMLEHIGNVADAADQTVDAKGRDFFEVFIETMEKLEFSFNEEGEHEMVLVMHPDMVKKLRENPPTPEQEERARQLMDRKRKEWNATRRRRDLPRFGDGARV